MATVKVNYQDFREFKNQGSFSIESDQDFNPFKWTPPINWQGYIKDVKISFIQKNACSLSDHDFDFSNLPDQFHRFIPNIIEAIDDAMRVMD